MGAHEAGGGWSGGQGRLEGASGWLLYSIWVYTYGMKLKAIRHARQLPPEARALKQIELESRLASAILFLIGIAVLWVAF